MSDRTAVSSETSHTRTLKRAMEIARSLPALADYLGVDEKELAEWIKGLSRAPSEVYLRALDLVAHGRLESCSPGATD